MIVPLISAVWLATLVLIVAVCRMAAHGERAALPRTSGVRSPRLLDSAYTLDTPDGWPRTLTLRLEDRRAKPADDARSEPAAAEHVGNGAQQYLYVRP